MSITADARHTLHPKIERRKLVLAILAIRQPGLLEVRHDEAAEATVNVETNLVGGRQLAEGDDIVLIPVRKIHSRSD